MSMSHIVGTETAGLDTDEIIMARDAHDLITNLKVDFI